MISVLTWKREERMKELDTGGGREGRKDIKKTREIRTYILVKSQQKEEEEEKKEER